jgi:hypothetical protein
MVDFGGINKDTEAQSPGKAWDENQILFKKALMPQLAVCMVHPGLASLKLPVIEETWRQVFANWFEEADMQLARSQACIPELIRLIQKQIANDTSANLGTVSDRFSALAPDLEEVVAELGKVRKNFRSFSLGVSGHLSSQDPLDENVRAGCDQAGLAIYILKRKFVALKNALELPMKYIDQMNDYYYQAATIFSDSEVFKEEPASPRRKLIEELIKNDRRYLDDGLSVIRKGRNLAGELAKLLEDIDSFLALAPTP